MLSLREIVETTLNRIKSARFFLIKEEIGLKVVATPSLVYKRISELFKFLISYSITN